MFKKGIILLLVFSVLGFLVRPPVNGGKVSSLYGIRIAHDRIFHTGTDIALPTGEPVNSVSWGTVKETGFDERSGIFVIISHLPGTESRYLHLDSVNVKEGQKVNPQTIIGTVGNTGISSGSHLHYEIRLIRVPLPPYILCLPGTLMRNLGIHSFIDSLVGEKTEG